MSGKNNMRLDLYQVETAQVAKEQGALLEDVHQKLKAVYQGWLEAWVFNY